MSAMNAAIVPSTTCRPTPVIGEVHHQVKLTERAAPDTHASTADA